MFGQITTGMIFLLVAYLFKTKSFWNQNKPMFRKLNDGRVIVNIWRERNSSDFLQYLKFEFIQYVHFGSYFITSYVLIPKFTMFMFESQNRSNEMKIYNYVEFINYLNLITNLLQIIFLRILLIRKSRSSKINERSKRRFCIMTVTLMILISLSTVFMIVFFGFYFGDIRTFFLDSRKTILVLWAQV